MSIDAWQWGWDALAAIGTIAAVAVALGLSLLDGIARLLTRQSRRRLQWVLLWPVVHDCRAALTNAALSPLMHIEIEVTDDLRSLLRYSSDQLTEAASACQKLVEQLDATNANRITALAAISMQVASYLRYLDSRPKHVQPLVAIAIRERLKAECDRGVVLADQLCALSEACVAKASGTAIYSYEENLERDVVGYGVKTRWPQ